MKSAKLEWSLNDLKPALKLLDEALGSFPDFPKLWMMTGQIYEQMKDLSKAFDAYNSGVHKYKTPKICICLMEVIFSDEKMSKCHSSVAVAV